MKCDVKCSFCFSRTSRLSEIELPDGPLQPSPRPFHAMLVIPAIYRRDGDIFRYSCASSHFLIKRRACIGRRIFLIEISSGDKDNVAAHRLISDPKSAIIITGGFWMFPLVYWLRWVPSCADVWNPNPRYYSRTTWKSVCVCMWYRFLIVRRRLPTQPN